MDQPTSTQNPWLSVWVRPKATIERIISSNPNRSLWTLAAIYGFSSLLNLFQTFSLGLLFAPLPIYILAAVLSPFWGYALFSIWSWLVFWTSRWFKGQGTFQEMRAAYAWSCVPLVFNIPLWILTGFLFGNQVFLNYPDSHLLTDNEVFALFLVLIAKTVVAIWSLVIYVNMVAAAGKFSVLRALGSLITAVVIAAIAMTAFMVVLTKIMQISQGA